jgi:hypothetical protein
MFHAFTALLLASTPLQSGPAQGVTLFAPMSQNDVFLIDSGGAIVHTWPGIMMPGLSVYLTDQYDLLRTVRSASGQLPSGFGGGVELVAWDGSVQWQFTYNTPGQFLQHHDIEWLPGGTVLLVAWTWKTRQEALNAGRDPAFLHADANRPFLPDHIIEVEPQGAGGATVVWGWHVWDHLVQDFDASKQNFGIVADHPELIDVNFPPMVPFNDWNHVNTVSYNAELDQIMLTSRHLNEIWVIDHSTTTSEAASHAGGQHGRGGDLLYRWGNPRSYGRGTVLDQKLFGPHDGQWIAPDRLGAGNMIVFNNGLNRPAGVFSSVDEIAPPSNPSGDYAILGGAPFGPSATVWEYSAPVATDFYSHSISGCERLANDNTLICSGDQGWIFEVDPAGALVWQYQNSIPNPANPRVFKARRYGEETGPLNYCSAGANSVNPGGASIGWGGSLSVTSNTLLLTVSNLPPNQVGIFFFGATVEHPAAPFGAGLRCVSTGGLKRVYPPNVTGSGSVARAVDFQLAPFEGLWPGDLRHCQFWYRDPSLPGGPPFNLTDALSVTLAP